ncbi:MAG TPA: hypothetical protein VFB96_21745 [Pirellulaceae bacterium]|nr:hypothetical protein [Pirellulaceae bacterium]
MDNFPTIRLILRRAQHPLIRQRMAIILLAAIEMLPLLFGPYLMYLFSHRPEEKVFSTWLNPWAYGQTAAIGFACIALPGRWHIRVILSLLAVYCVWLTYMLGIQMSAYAPHWVSPTARPLASQLLWIFTCSAFYSSLVVSASGIEIRLENPLPITGLRAGQISLGFITTCIFAGCLTLALLRVALFAPRQWPQPEAFLTATPRQAVQLTIWSLAASLAMTATAASRRHWWWLAAIMVCALLVEYLLHPFKPRRWYQEFFSGGSDFTWQMPVITIAHSFLLVLAWSRVGILLPRLARLDSLHRALQSVR